MDEVVLALEGAIAPMECFLDDDATERVLVLARTSRRGSTARRSCCGCASRAASSARCRRTTLAELVEFSRRDPGRRRWSRRRAASAASPAAVPAS